MKKRVYGSKMRLIKIKYFKNKKMKTEFTKQGMKKIAIALTLSAFGFVANAQQKTATITKQATATLGKIGTGAADGGAVRVIDNKGTIKYLQVQNGITQVTSTLPAGGVITTWQLGGTLTDDTYIDATNKVFALDGISFATLPASTDATDKSIHGTGTGYTLLVRDEATGAVQKLKMADLVKGGQVNGTATAGANYTLDDPSITADVSKVWVYRNGAKLLGGVDYTVTGTVVTVKFENTTDPEDYAFITGDRIEIQWVK